MPARSRLQSARRSLPCGAKGEPALSPAAPNPSQVRPGQVRIVDPASEIILPGVELDLAEAEKIAQRRQSEGRLGEAAILYGRIVESVPGHLESLLALGSFVLKTGRLPEATALFQKAVEAAPDNAVALTNLGAVQAMQGNLVEAEDAFRRATVLNPNYVDAHRNLGVTLHRLQRLDEAVAALRIALKIGPGQPLIERNLAAALLDSNQAAEAAALYRRSLARQPQVPAGYVGLALALRALGDRAGAVTAFQQAISLAPKNPRPLLEMGKLLMDEAQYEGAIDSLRRAAALAPQDAAIQTALAEALIADQQIAEGAIACERAIAADPDNIKAMLAFAALLDALDRSLDVIGVLRQASEREPESKIIHRRLGEALLKSGDFSAGWPSFESARTTGELPLPLWQGEDIAGKRLLVEAGEDIGDILLLARFLPSVAAGGAQVYLRCPRALFGLFTGLPGVALLLAPGGVVPPCDLAVQLTSLPRLLGLRIEAIPPALGWLRPPAERLAPWRQRLAQLPAPRIGLVWRTSADGVSVANSDGNSADPKSVDHRGDLPTRSLSELVGRAHGSFVALNAQDRRAEIAAAGLGHRITDLGAEFPRDTLWGEMAAAIDGVDLLIAVDSPAAHLAGALGRPAWLLLAQPASWCWFRDRGDSPWYPTLRLLRQPKPGAWDNVINQVIARLGDEEAS
ncbi:MAG TPA: tetratricopeptide repeat protein [Candidatus Polarisedimenticolia bacterium]|nr:tetratricopeptide repeat protein [Candidatus Polarisedimenticolia bacterium]